VAPYLVSGLPTAAARSKPRRIRFRFAILTAMLITTVSATIGVPTLRGRVAAGTTTGVSGRPGGFGTPWVRSSLLPLAAVECGIPRYAEQSQALEALRLLVALVFVAWPSSMASWLRRFATIPWSFSASRSCWAAVSFRSTRGGDGDRGVVPHRHHRTLRGFCPVLRGAANESLLCCGVHGVTAVCLWCSRVVSERNVR